MGGNNSLMEARYDIAKEIAGHDFYSWLVVAKSKGADKIVFGIDNPKETKWSKEVVLERFRSIMEPGPAMVGLKYRIGNGGEVNVASPHMMDLVKFCKSGGKIHRLKSVYSLAVERFTVTIRHEPRILEMNSNQEAWRKFAESIGATVFEDYNDMPLALNTKLAIYSQADMNFGVVNGPMHLLTLSEYPVTIFKANVSASNLAKHGIPTGSQLPWAKENQRMVWEDDSYDNLMRYFEKNFSVLA